MRKLTCQLYDVINETKCLFGKPFTKKGGEIINLKKKMKCKDTMSKETDLQEKEVENNRNENSEHWKGRRKSTLQEVD